MLPGFDIYLEYIYKDKFKNKLKALYGFDYNEVKNVNNKMKKTQEEKEIMMTEEEKLISDSNISQLLDNSDDEKMNLCNESLVYKD